MDFLEATETQIVIAGFVVAIAAFYIINSKKPKGCLDPEKFRDFKLVKRTQLSHNVAKFRFALATPTSVFGLPIGQHISCRGKDSQGEEVIKPYTPTTVDTDLGYFELVIKGRFKYRFGDVRAYGMLAGGSGITPMFQVARYVLEGESDESQTTIDLIYANVTYDDNFCMKKSCINFWGKKLEKGIREKRLHQNY